jgi:hypothetical protein
MDSTDSTVVTSSDVSRSSRSGRGLVAIHILESDAMSSAASTEPTANASRNVVVRSLPAIPRVLMGAMFLFSGLFGLLAHPQAPPGLPERAIAFNAALTNSGYMMPLIAGIQALAGALLLANRFVPLALALLAPIVVNIFAFHLFLEHGGLPVAVIVAAVELFLAWQYRDAYRPMLAARTPRSTAR